MIPFSPPRIDQKIIDEVIAALKSGWITTGPRVKEFERQITSYCGHQSTLCLNSATAGLELILRWFGVKEGDEVILPAYTYSATANVVIHCGARPVLADIGPDFNIDVNKIRDAITPRTKVIMPVDFGGFPCDYDKINSLVRDEAHRKLFNPSSENQEKLGRILVLSDAAHSFGATYNGHKTGSLTDISVFSFHAVKNLTTAEGGAVALNLPDPFNNQSVYDYLCIYSLHGQNKDALAKMQKGNWKYDIIEAGYKCNMTDLTAAIGLVELNRYDTDMIVKRKHICNSYDRFFKGDPRIHLPILKSEQAETSYHLYPIRIKGVDEKMRDEIMKEIFGRDVSVNVHFIPLPLLSFYKKMGYKMEDYPIAYETYSREISLPVFYDLSDSQIETVCLAVKEALNVQLPL